jgi:hypothetical protein
MPKSKLKKPNMFPKPKTKGPEFQTEVMHSLLNNPKLKTIQIHLYYEKLVQRIHINLIGMMNMPNFYLPAKDH